VQCFGGLACGFGAALSLSSTRRTSARRLASRTVSQMLIQFGGWPSFSLFDLADEVAASVDEAAHRML